MINFRKTAAVLTLFAVLWDGYLMKHEVSKNEVEQIRSVLCNLIRKADAANNRMTSFDDLSDEDADAIRSREAAQYLLDVLNTGTETEKTMILDRWKRSTK